MRLSASLMTCLVVAGLAGCGESDGLDRARIMGVITVQGEPMEFASIRFIPVNGTPGEGAIGLSDASGKFEVTSSRQDDAGIPPGEYTVAVSRWANPDGSILGPEATQADNPSARETVPPPFSGEGSPLKATISKEGGEVKIDIPTKLREFKKKKA